MKEEEHGMLHVNSRSKLSCGFSTHSFHITSKNTVLKAESERLLNTVSMHFKVFEW